MSPHKLHLFPYSVLPLCFVAISPAWRLDRYVNILLPCLAVLANASQDYTKHGRWSNPESFLSLGSNSAPKIAAHRDVTQSVADGVWFIHGGPFLSHDFDETLTKAERGGLAWQLSKNTSLHTTMPSSLWCSRVSGIRISLFLPQHTDLCISS